MRCLAIDTSTEIASVALLTGAELFSEEQSNPRTHAQFIVPMIHRLLAKAGLQMHQLDTILFGCGPGSFTGLRIACSIAKGLAYAHDLGLVPVSSLAAIAWSVRQNIQSPIPVLAALDARMHELYWAYFAQDQWTATEKVSAVRELCLPKNQVVILAGVGIDLYWDEFSTSIKAQISNKLTVYPLAESMIQFAEFTGLKPISIDQAQPVYIRNKVT